MEIISHQLPFRLTRTSAIRSKYYKKKNIHKNLLCSTRKLTASFSLCVLETSQQHLRPSGQFSNFQKNKTEGFFLPFCICACADILLSCCLLAFLAWRQRTSCQFERWKQVFLMEHVFITKWLFRRPFKLDFTDKSHKTGKYS